MQTAEFAVVQRINHELAFKWWVKHILKIGVKIIASVTKWQASYLKKSHKYSKELSKSVEQDLFLDAKNDNTLWADAISKEMKNVRVAFKILPDGKPASIGHQFV